MNEDEIAERYARAKARLSKLDDAVREFFEDLHRDNDDPGVYSVVSWVIGIAVTGMVDIEERDGAVFEASPGANLYTIRGLSDATAEFFRKATPSDPYDRSYYV